MHSRECICDRMDSKVIGDCNRMGYDRSWGRCLFLKNWMLRFRGSAVLNLIGFFKEVWVKFLEVFLISYEFIELHAAKTADDAKQ